MYKRPAVVHFLLDGFKPDYLAHAPFLQQLATGAFTARAREPFGFETRAGFLAGLYPETSDYCTRFWYDPSRRPFRWLRPLAPLAQFLSISGTAEHYLRRGIEAVVRRTSRSPALAYNAGVADIPFTMLSEFGFPETLLPWDSEYTGGPTIFHVLRSHNLRWLYQGWPLAQADGGVQAPGLATALEQGPYDFMFLHFALTDEVGHEYGPDAPETAAAVARVDAEVRALYDYLVSNYQALNIIVYGDHGQATVTHQVDAWRKLKTLPLKPRRDFLYFLDSTAVRCWCFNDRARRLVAETLQELDGGHVLGAADFARLRANFPHQKYWETIWLADPGVLVYPNYFQRRTTPPRGMHGYDPAAPENEAFFLLKTASPTKVASRPVLDLVDIFPTTLELLGLPVPPSSQGRSLLEH